MTRSETWPADPHDRGKAILGALLALTILSIITIALRFYVRKRIGAALAGHDWTMFVALLLQIANQACIVESYRWGLGAHDVNLIYDANGNFIPSMPWTNMTKWIYISTVPGVLTSIFARISITLLLISLFGSKRWLMWFLIVTTACLAVVGFLSIIFTWAQSSPVEGLWNPLLPARRWNPNIQFHMVYVAGSIFAFTDLSFVLAPIMIIWRLNMPFSRRLGLCILMAGSIFCLVACIMRIITAAHQNLYTSAEGMLWAGLEQCLVIMLGSAPPLAALRNLDLANKISASLSSIANSSLFASLRTHGRKTTDRRGGSNGSGQASSDAIKPAGPYERAPSDHDIKAVTTINQTTSDGVYNMNDLRFV